MKYHMTTEGQLLNEQTIKNINYREITTECFSTIINNIQESVVIKMIMLCQNGLERFYLT